MLEPRIHKKPTFLQTSRWALATVAFCGALLLLWIAFGIYDLFFFSNYAKEAARPLETALIEAGATKKSEGGSSGRGPDNYTPRYNATYEISKNKIDTIMLVYQLTKSQGYHLTHASPSNRGSLWAVDDKYLDQWYFDETHKSSPYRDLKSGPVRLLFKIGDEDKQEIPNRTTFRLELSLPEFK